MAPLSRATTSAARAWTRHTLPRPSAAAIAFPTTQSRGRADIINKEIINKNVVPTSKDFAPNTPGVRQDSSTFDSPFHRSGGTMRDPLKVPSFGHYKSNRSETTNKVFQYFMVGGLGAITAMGAKATVQGELRMWWEVMRQMAAEDALPQERSDMWKQALTKTLHRLPRQHGCFRRCFGSGQG
jgi:hypothetical protein